MYKVIDGHRYNTETAKYLSSWEPNPYRSDFHYFEEQLYRTKAGLYFIYGYGNAASKYAESCGQNEWCSGEKIIPVDETVAKQWVSEHCKGEKYDEIFGSEDEDPVSFTIKLDPIAAEKFKELKKQTGKSYTDMLTEWIREA